MDEMICTKYKDEQNIFAYIDGKFIIHSLVKNKPDTERCKAETMPEGVYKEIITEIVDNMLKCGYVIIAAPKYTYKALHMEIGHCVSKERIRVVIS